MNSKKDIEQKRINVAVLGATGVVGQVFLHLLAHHPWFKLSMINGSVSRNGKTYGNEVQWLLPVPMPETVENMKLEALHIDGEPECRRVIGQAVLDSAREQNVRERAWFSPQGWDTETEAPAPLETFFGSHPKN